MLRAVSTAVSDGDDGEVTDSGGLRARRSIRGDVKSYKDNVVVVNVNAPGGAIFCRALRKKTLAQATNITTLCGAIVPGITEVHRPGLAIVTCTRCRALENGGRDPSSYRVVPRFRSK